MTTPITQISLLIYDLLKDRCQDIILDDDIVVPGIIERQDIKLILREILYTVEFLIDNNESSFKQKIENGYYMDMINNIKEQDKEKIKGYLKNSGEDNYRKFLKDLENILQNIDHII
jgi:hypothetical protein